MTSYQNNDVQTHRNIRQQTKIIYQQTLNTVYLCCTTYIPLPYESCYIIVDTKETIYFLEYSTVFTVETKNTTRRSKQDLYFYHRNLILPDQISMAITSDSILLPYLEDTGLIGKKLYTPKEWTERLRHYIKRIHNIDIKPALSWETIPTSNEWTTKEPERRQDFIWGAGPSAIETITKGGFNTDPDTINTEKLIQLFKDYYMPQQNTYHNRGDFFCAKQEENETPEEHWQKLVFLEKKLRIQRHQTRRSTNIEIYHKYNQQKTTGKALPQKDPKPENCNGPGNSRQLWKKT